MSENSQQTTAQQNDEESPVEVSLQSQAGIVGIESRDYESMEYTTRMKTDFLQSALNIVNELGWDEIDIYAVHDESDALCENVMLHIRPKDSPYWGDEAGISVAPRRTQPDKELRDHE